MTKYTKTHENRTYSKVAGCMLVLVILVFCTILNLLSTVVYSFATQELKTVFFFIKY